MNPWRRSGIGLCPLKLFHLMSLQGKIRYVPLALPSLEMCYSRPRQKLRLPLRRRASSVSCTSANTVSAPARRPFIALHPLSAARYAFNRSVKSFRSWSTSGRRSSASIAPTDALFPPAPVPMSVDDYGPMLFQDIDWLAYEANQQAFTSTQQLHPRDILHAQELDDFFTECENLDYTEARLFDGSESKGMAPEENSGTSIKSSDIEDDADSPIMLYAGLRQCGGVTQRNRGRVTHDYWSIKDEELMRSDQEAIRTAFLDERKAVKEQSKTVLVDEQNEEQKGQVEQQVEQMEQIEEERTEVPAEETI